jgi:aldehyde dehydrogenase (NAD+)
MGKLSMNDNSTGSVNISQKEKIVHGGRINKEKLFIEPTILDEIKAGATVMQDEIFGPVLPVLSFDKKKKH